MQHFGEWLDSSQFGEVMARATYGYPSRTPHQRFHREQMPARYWAERAWQFRDEEQTRFSDAFLLWNRDEALRNYDLSLAYFDTLDAAEFETALTTVLSEGRSLQPVEDLAEWEGVEGVYVMVFDRFKQLYVGQSANVRKRVRQHWTGRKSFDRLVWGTPYDSILPVDELRALDTTRLYAARSVHPDTLEARLERAADPRFTLNRTAGGAFNPLGILLTGARARDHALTATPATPEEYRAARDVIKDHVEAARHDATSPVPLLAALDMGIRVEVDQDGRQHFWSNRDLVGAALRSGLLTAAEFEEFLTRLGGRS
ncbi:GIY-YIG nuclease family protein [Curtobacterium flaccumfaciens]|uniref:GIY-YIG nuclease family protein n=1 Tax=Curtobacterium flaccumfaciens TaxID=2035 RepID=UPI00188B9BA9|nr:GIY-YIG nuclease family protein [Curtobacterium flaccumfaciens]MBF4595616.1 GIY-YIG nuclease family protein [Curtobacterium flaccumfaciens]